MGSLGTLRPLLAAWPEFLLPDRGPLLELVYQVLRSGERVATVGTGNSNRHRRLQKIDSPNAMLNDDGVEWPSRPGLVNQRLDRRLDRPLVRLVVEMGDAIFARRMVANRSEEQRRGSAGHVSDLGHQTRCVDWVGRNPDSSVIKTRYGLGLHRIKCMEFQDDRRLPSGEVVPPGTPIDMQHELESTRNVVDDLGDEPLELLVVEDVEDQPTGLTTIIVVSVTSALLASALTVGALFALGAITREPDRIETIIQQPTVVDASAQGRPDVVAAVAAEAIPSIVTVQQFGSFDDFGPIASGSGVIFRSDGYILTNDHVIANAETIRVVFYDGLSYPAVVVGTDPLMDIAVLKVEVDGLRPIPTAISGSPAIGDLAIAVGNPLGLDGGPSVTSGVISALDRRLTINGLGGNSDLYGLLQTDAPITRGSSGGALLNRSGQLIGITTAIGVTDVGAEGLGFVVPVDLVNEIANDLIADGSVAHAFLGIEGGSAAEVRADGSEAPLGAEIRSLLDGSAIGEAGAEAGDIIVALDGERVNSMILLVARLRTYRAGDEVTVTVQRGTESIDILLVLDRHPSS